MSTDPGVAGGYLSAESAAQLEQAQTQQAAAESAGITQTAAQTAAQITERGPLLPAESDIEALMAALRAQSDQIAALSKQVGVMQAQTEQAQAASGGPLTVRYAQAAVDKLAAHSAQWPAHDLSAAAAAAGDMLAAAQSVVKGNAAAAPVLQSAESAIRRLAGRLPHIDWSAILDDVATAAEEGLKLAAVV